MADRLFNLLDFVEEQAVRENARLMKELRDIYNIDPFDLTDKQFVKVFRLSKEAVIYLCDSLRSILQHKGARGISVKTQV